MTGSRHRDRSTELLLQMNRICSELLDLRLQEVEGSTPPSHTATARMRELLSQNPERVFTLRDLGAALPEVSAQTVRATIGRFCRDKDGAEVVSRGRYRFLRRR